MARSVIVAGNFPANDAKFATFGRNVEQKLTGNARYPAPPVPPPTLGALLDAFQTTIDKRGPGTASARKEARSKVETALRQNATYVESGAAGLSPEDATSAIEGAGYSVKKKGKYDKPAYAIVRGKVEGSVLAKVKAQGRHGTIQYCHGHSLDGGTTWIDHPPTIDTSLAISGLPAGTSVSFRFRTLKKGAYGDWSQVLKMRIN
jgi:hypothetical protein